MHGSQPATRRLRKILNAFFLKQCSQNRWDLYLQKLLSDSTEPFFILKNMLLARGGTRKNYKKLTIYNFQRRLKGRKIQGKVI